MGGYLGGYWFAARRANMGDNGFLINMRRGRFADQGGINAKGAVASLARRGLDTNVRVNMIFRNTESLATAGGHAESRVNTYW